MPMMTLVQDVRYGFRMLGKSPGLTVIMALTLALGIGANTAIFSVINGLLLRPLPVPAPEQITVLAAQQKGDYLGVFYLSHPQIVDFRKEAGVFSDILASQVSIGGLSFEGNATQFVFAYVTGNYFSGLGVKPALGRFFLSSEGERSGQDPLVVLGYSFWQKRFGGDPGIVGRQVLVDGKPATVIGVAPKGFRGTSFAVDMEGYLPLNMMAIERDTSGMWTNRSQREFIAMGRLKPGVSLAQAQSSVNVVAQRLAEQYPATDKGITLRVIPETLARPQPFANNIVPIIAGLFLALAALVLLLACMNVANILLVRATVRRREVAIRAALGASRGRLVRQLLTESILMALLGGVGGVVLGGWASGAITSLLPKADLPLYLDFGFDWRVFAFALAAAASTGIVVGLWPALHSAGTDASAVLHEGGRSDTAGVGRHRVRSALVVAQVAGSLMLLIVAGLFVRSLSRIQHTNLGFDPDHLLNVLIDPHEIGYDTPRTKEFYRELEGRVRALPGVESASLAFSVPMGNYMDGRGIHVEGHPLALGLQPPVVLFNRIDADYFKTLRVPFLRGRLFTDSDNETAPPVAIVNQAMASQFWPNEDPIGKRFSMAGPNGPFVQVVGVAADGKYAFLGWEHKPYFYVPIAQNYTSFEALHVRSSVSPESLIAQVRNEVRTIDPNMPISSIKTMTESLEGANGFFIFRLGATLAGIMGILGLTLAVVGVYGVVSFAASQRTHEIGIRLALGAERSDILHLVLGQGLGLVGAGVLAGLVAAWALTRAMANLLVGVTPTDPLTFTSATLFLAAIALFACYMPARRATRVDPMVALRYE
jgi:putative ABC transport system permease protein